LKKVFAIALLLLFLFNVGGYYFMFYGLTYQANKQLVQRFDNDDYSEEETITLKIPITLPYPIFEDDFQRVNGEFEYQGEHYKLVKQKLEGDTVYVVCYRDYTIKRILNAFSDFAKFSNDLPFSSKNSLIFMGKLVKDYEPIDQPMIVHRNGWSRTALYAQLVFNLLDREFPVVAPPPEQVS
jgi:hypothetical protein